MGPAGLNAAEHDVSDGGFLFVDQTGVAVAGATGEAVYCAGCPTAIFVGRAGIADIMTLGFSYEDVMF